MNASSQLTMSHPQHRRGFLQTAGLLSALAPSTLAAASLPDTTLSPDWHRRGKIVWMAEGIVPFTYVLPPPQINLPPNTPPMEARARLTFPVSRNKCRLSVQVFMVPEGLPVLPLPEPPPLVPQKPDDPVTISYFEVEIDDLKFGESPIAGTDRRMASLQFNGRVLNNPVLSPFGDLTGAPATFSTAYAITDAKWGTADFVFCGGIVAGSHATVAPTAKGYLLLPR
ncbi:MAG: hypothetical protein JNK85_28735 [Verrucomicrobiales bacterium]|nr:hypothetical protein [Verrucomicrobiales bacterium]